MSDIDISIVLPTFNEALNIPVIVPQIVQTFSDSGLCIEIIVVDDQSPDDTYQVAQSLATQYPVRPILRTGAPGLSASVIDGFKAASGSVLVVMDADGSHSVDSLLDMVRPVLADQADITIGSRYIESSQIDHQWPWYRLLISRMAILFSRGITRLSDPTSGFMAVKRSLVRQLDLNPIGWKIVLETVIKAGKNARVQEVPIVFSDRILGESKMNLNVQLQYLVHLTSLYRHRFPTLIQLVFFILIGFVSMCVDMSTVILCRVLFQFDVRLLAVCGFCVAVINSYLLNRYFTFQIMHSHRMKRTALAFVSVNFLGLLIRLFVIHLLLTMHLFNQSHYIILNLIGIFFGMFSNFFFSKFVVFSQL